MALSFKAVEDLVKQHAADAVGTVRHLREAVDQKKFGPTDIEVGQLFEACYGSEVYKRCRRREMTISDAIDNGRRLLEGPGAVGSSNFLDITGQIVYSAVLPKYQMPAFIFTGLIPTVSTQFLNGEKMAGITQIGDEAQARAEFDPYIEAGVTQDYIFTPELVDRGEIVSLTWEAVFSDRTGQLLERAGAVGESLGLNKEKRAIDCVIDENTTAHRYNWKNLGAIASYGDSSGSHSWDNLAATNALVDWTDVDNAEQLLNAMTDPFTGEPFTWTAPHLVVTKQLEKTALRIRNATEIVTTTPGYATSDNPNGAKWSNPVGSTFDVITSQFVAPRLGTDTSWFYGNIGMYAKYMQAEPLTVTQAAAGNDREFRNRIVAQFRANERGAYVVVQPRAMVKSTA